MMRWIYVLIIYVIPSVYAAPDSLPQDGCLPRSGIKPASSFVNGLGSQPTYMLDIPVRFQWAHNSGYCGETSLISAGLYYGQYVSQYQVRELIDPTNPTVQTTKQVLLGATDNQNAGLIANALHLTYDQRQFPAGNLEEYLVWIKENILNNHPVTIGVMMNFNHFYGCNSGCDGCSDCTAAPDVADPEYDHIVPVLGIGSDTSFTSPSALIYNDNDTLFISDNGLYGNVNMPNNPPNLPNPENQYIFAHNFGPTPNNKKTKKGHNADIVPNPYASFRGDRMQANLALGHTYCIPVVEAGQGYNTYGIAITGIKTDGTTIPVRVYTNVNYEQPAIQHGQESRPTPMPLILTVVGRDLVSGVTYNLYKYNDLSKVPDSNFNANSNLAIQKWVISPTSSYRNGNTFTVIDHIQSDDVAVFRCVPE